MNLSEYQEVKLLYRERKAALRECGRLGDKLHTARLEIESLRHRIRELEARVKDADSARYKPEES